MRQRNPRVSRAGRSPLNGIDEDLPHLWTIIIIVGFVAGREVEHSAFADRPTESHSPRLSLAVGFGIEAVQGNSFGRGDGKRFAIPLDFRKLKILYTLTDRMVGILNDYFCGGPVSNVFAPTTVSAEQLLEWR